MSSTPLPTDWSGLRIRLKRRGGWLFRWYWTVSNGINGYDGGFAMTRAAAVRKANKAAARAKREQAWDAEEEVWEFEPKYPVGDSR
jgi:hypothetical protein